MLLWLALAHAALFVSPSGSDSPSCGSEATPCLTLQEAVRNSASNDTINVEPAHYSGAGNTAVSISHSLTINFGTLENSAVFDASNTSYLFQLNSTSVTFNYGVFQNARVPQAISSSFGGIVTISSGSVLRANNCLFQDSSSQYGGAALLGGSANLICNNCTFRRCSAAMNGGAIYFNGAKASLSNCAFESNEATDGGAIYATGSALSANDTTFSGNYALSDGGSLVLFSSSLRSNRMNVTRSTSYLHGGVVYLFGPGGLFTCVDCSFSDSTSMYGSGGVVYSYSESVLVFSNTQMVNNYALQYGGAVYSGVATTLSLINCNATSNSATYGGALSFSDRATGSLTMCEFNANNASSEGLTLYCSDSSLSLADTYIDPDSITCSLQPAYTFCSISGASFSVPTSCGQQNTPPNTKCNLVRFVPC
jgi:predicted outer membrane repeat protein